LFGCGEGVIRLSVWLEEVIGLKSSSVLSLYEMFVLPRVPTPKPLLLLPYDSKFDWLVKEEGAVEYDPFRGLWLPPRPRACLMRQ